MWLTTGKPREPGEKEASEGEGSQGPDCGRAQVRGAGLHGPRARVLRQVSGRSLRMSRTQKLSLGPTCLSHDTGIQGESGWERASEEMLFGPSTIKAFH